MKPFVAPEGSLPCVMSLKAALVEAEDGKSEEKAGGVELQSVATSITQPKL